VYQGFGLHQIGGSSSDARQRMLDVIDTFSQPAGKTAFYDAVGQALDELDNKPNRVDGQCKSPRFHHSLLICPILMMLMVMQIVQIVIALTDGDDNCSIVYDIPEKLEAYVCLFFYECHLVCYSFGCGGYGDSRLQQSQIDALIIVSVGEISVGASLERLAKCTRHGRYIICNDRHGANEIDKAFDEVPLFMPHHTPTPLLIKCFDHYRSPRHSVKLVNWVKLY
jgi:hypothetical protein